MSNDFLNKGFYIVKLTITALMLDLVSLELVVVEEGLEQFAGVHSILENTTYFGIFRELRTTTLSGRIVSISP